MTIPIVYAGGAYGTYLEWCLTTLSNNKVIQAPFGKNGNSHGYVGNQLYDFAGWQKFRRSGKSAPFVRLHPKVRNGESVTDHLTRICNDAEYVIHLYPDQDSIVLCLNNSYTKIWNDWWGVSIRGKQIDAEELYNNWPVDRNASIDNIPTWIRREFLSYRLVDGYFDQLEWYQPDTWQSPNCLVVSVTDLLHNFEQTLNNIKQFCKLDFAKPISDLVPYHTQNLSLQTYLTHDKLCKDIVDAVIHKQELNWAPLSLVSECWIQHQLRELGYGIKCHGLDTFPTSSVQLRELLYPV